MEAYERLAGKKMENAEATSKQDNIIQIWRGTKSLHLSPNDARGINSSVVRERRTNYMHDRTALKTQWNSMIANGETREVTKGGAAVLPVAASVSPRLVLLDATKTGTQAKDLEEKLRHLVIGQDEAIHEIVRTYQTLLAGLSPVGRPIGNFLFLGPTCCGKTRTVEATAEALVNNPRAVIKIDCAEFQHSHEIAKLIGSPPGYLGHRE